MKTLTLPSAEIFPLAVAKPIPLHAADDRLSKWICEVIQLRQAMNSTADLDRKVKLAKMIAQVLAEGEEVFLDFTRAVPQ